MQLRKCSIEIGMKGLLWYFWINLGLCFGIAVGCSTLAQASTLNQVSVGATYYGGHFDQQYQGWIIDNAYQCDRIKSGEFTAESLNAMPSKNCDDDPGYGYFDYVPLHNTMSYAELSIDPAGGDYSALGNLPARTKLQVEYNRKCVVIEKLDVGGGGFAVKGNRRSIDLWWQTARSLGFTNGFDVVSVSYIDQNTPLTPLGQTSPCYIKPVTPPAPIQEEIPIPEPSNDLDKPVGATDDAQQGEQESVETSDKPQDDPTLSYEIIALGGVLGLAAGSIFHLRYRRNRFTLQRNK